MNLGDIRDKINAKGFSRKILDFFYWEISWILMLVFVILSGYCVFVWYKYVYNPHWSEVQKTQYIKTNSNEVTFNKNGFQAAIGQKSRRDSDYQKNISDLTDIFRLNANSPDTNESGVVKNTGH